MARHACLMTADFSMDPHVGFSSVGVSRIQWMSLGAKSGYVQVGFWYRLTINTKLLLISEAQEMSLWNTIRAQLDTRR